MIEVQDEVLVGEPRSRIKDANGNIIYDNVSIEMITPVAQEGTPLNKVFFESIKSGNDLVQKYNVAKFNKLENEIIYLTLPNIIAKYETGMRVLITPEEKNEHITSSPIPTFPSRPNNSRWLYINSNKGAEL